MDNGRFGPVHQNEPPKKKYKINSNRLITFVMLAIVIVLSVVIATDAFKKPKNDVPIIDVPLSSGLLPAQGLPSNPPIANLRPLPAGEGLLPIFNKANTDRHRVCIVIVGGGGGENELKALGALCEASSAKVTLFPTGVELNQNRDYWGAMALAGHQIENHTYDNRTLVGASAEDMAGQIGAQTSILREILGNDYQPHFLMTSDFGFEQDPILNKYLSDNGYYGIVCGTFAAQGSYEYVEPGQILVYSLNATGIKELRAALPEIGLKGYEMVTLNDMFEYPDNIDYE